MQIVLTLLVVGVFVGVPIWFFLSLRRKTFGELMYGPSGKRKSTGAVGRALQGLNRLIAKPSIEYKIEAEYEDKLNEDEKAGD
jgi:hypothetical protein